MRLLPIFTAALVLLSSTASAKYVVRSDFQLQLNEGIFDKIITSFWQKLNGKRTDTLPSYTFTVQDIPIHIEGIHTEVDYKFKNPARVSDRREWELEANDIAARIRVDRVWANHVIVREIGGVLVHIRVEAQCNNIALSMPAGNASLKATVSAEVAQNQVRIGLPKFEAAWNRDAWRVDSINCSGIEGLDRLLAQETLNVLGSFQDFNRNVKPFLEEQLAILSQDVSKLLLSEAELPSGKDYLRIYYKPELAFDTPSGIQMKGLMRFEYPYVSQGNDIENEFHLTGGDLPGAPADSRLAIPFATLRALMMGEYFAGKLEYSMYSTEIPAFQELMSSRWSQLFAWPDLMNWGKTTKFAFQFQPMGPPSFANERTDATNAIIGDMALPLSVRMFAPFRGIYTPYVEFRTMLQGAAALRLTKDGKINLQLASKSLDITYKWAEKYKSAYSPNEHIAVDTIGSAINGTLSKQGFDLSLPKLKVGESIELVPEKWNLNRGNLYLDFTTAR